MLTDEFKEKINSYPVDDLQLILDDQLDMYTSEEITYITQRIDALNKAELKKHLPQKITCDKCGGVNSFEDDYCKYCGAQLQKEKYYNLSYYEENTETNSEDENNHGHGFHYFASFIVPLVGFILGSILLSKDNEDQQYLGKICITLGMVSVIISIIVLIAIIANN